MLKKILIGLGIFAIIIIIGMVYLNHRNRTLSPPGETSYNKNGLTIEVKYSRPSVKGRLIFGAAADEALQPYGSYWRLGANEATEIKFLQNVTFNGVPLEKGTYRVYAVPGASTFKIGVNTELGKWGYSEPDYSKDLFTTDVPVTHLDEPVEQMTIRIEEAVNDGAIIYFEWSDVQLPVPISLN
jgi:hypothetical protein